ncbi:MAG: phenylalanine--tRNA ligase subunit beta [Persephonella sp.]|nr:MAG: phenylalanine--tRNA ligase subunit beta [Persephonella sp.]
MKVPYSWIREFVDIDKSAEEVVDRLNETGLEATVETFGEYIPELTTVRVLSVKKHPERDKLYICEATDGRKKYQIITGADNVVENSIVLMAKVGAKINGIIIKERNFGSYKSEGMFLSLEELGLADTSEGIWLLPEDTPIGVDGSELLGLGNEKIIEIDITPNRGDALSVKGLAREIGAIFNIKRKDYKANVLILDELIPNISVDTEKCYRYRGVIIRDIEIKPSNLDIQLKLLKSGQKPINNIVDITNYILLQEGQPLHAFDLDKIKGKVIVRNAKDGEKILALDGNEYNLKGTDIVIADENGVIAIAGIIGGENTKVDENTKNILLEAANFDYISVRKTSKRLGISTESSYRFERGVDIESLAEAQDKAIEMILKFGGSNSKAVGQKDIYPNPYTPKKIRLREKTVERVIGVNISKEECAEILNRLEIPTSVIDDGTISKIPAFRSLDITREIDLVEEVGRLKGFNDIPEDYPRISIEIDKNISYYQFERRSRDYFIDNGVNEIITYSFVGEDIYKDLGLPLPEIEITNYLTKDFRFMRDNLTVSLIQVIKENLRHQVKDISVFEISSVFFKDYEEIRLGIALTGKTVKGFSFTNENVSYNTTKSWDFLKVKGLILNYLKLFNIKDINLNYSKKAYLNPYESADIYVNGKEIGYFGKIHPKIAEKVEIPKDTYLAELKLKYVPRELRETVLKDGYIYSIYTNAYTPIFKDLPKYPSVKRDLAFEVDEDVSVKEIFEGLRKESNLIENIRLFDIFYLNNNKKSVAVSVEFRDKNKSLSDEDVNLEVENILQKLRDKIKGLKLRG